MIIVPIPGIRRTLGALAVMAAACMPSLAAKQSLLVFPVDKPEGVEQGVADTVQSGLRTRFEGNAQYDIITFHAKSPLVARAVGSGAITTSQLNGPFSPESASAIARAIGADAALVVTVEDAAFDAAAGKGSVTITAQIIAADSGKPVKSAGVSGDAAKSGTPGVMVLRLAADNAAAKAVSQLTSSPVKPGSTAGATAPAVAGPVIKSHKKSNKGRLLLGGLVILGVVIAASHHGGGGGGGGTDGPPPLPF